MASFLADIYNYNAIYPGAFYGSHTFPCRTLLLSTTILNDILSTFFDGIRVIHHSVQGIQY